MYKEYFGFTHYPFDKDIATDQLYQYKGFKEFQKRMEFLLQHKGISVIWGASGCGKTAGLRFLRDTLNKNRYRFFYLPETPNSISDFYRQLMITMELKPTFRRIDMYKQIQNYILDLCLEKKIVPIICLDECQSYPHTVIESVRLFTNFDMDCRHYLILILAGQTEFRKRLNYAVYEPLTQRITVNYNFTELSAEEVERYLLHRLDIAGVKHQLFEPTAIQFIYQVTNGIMRKIDILAKQSLLLAAGLKKNTIDQQIVDTTLKENIWS